MVVYPSCPQGQLNNAKFERNLKRNEKKFLTNEIGCGKLKKLRDEERKLGARPSQLEKLRKETKKVLDKA